MSTPQRDGQKSCAGDACADIVGIALLVLFIWILARWWNIGWKDGADFCSAMYEMQQQSATQPVTPVKASSHSSEPELSAEERRERAAWQVATQFVSAGEGREAV